MKYEAAAVALTWIPCDAIGGLTRKPVAVNQSRSTWQSRSTRRCTQRSLVGLFYTPYTWMSVQFGEQPARSVAA
jgi:hypothetical protein